MTTKTKKRLRCPRCNSVEVRCRVTLIPHYYCKTCGNMFEIPVVEEVELK